MPTGSFALSMSVMRLVMTTRNGLPSASASR